MSTTNTRQCNTQPSDLELTGDHQVDVLDELRRTVIEVALLECRADGIREQLSNARARRRGLGREYVKWVRATTH